MPFADRPFRDRWTWPLLLLLTLVGGGLRFASLDRPSVWGDEAATYGRVAGTYQDLLDQLADSSFPPLHYELEWWVAQGLPYWGHLVPPAANAAADAAPEFVPTKFLVPGGIRLTPFALRFIPALAGTLFVPAVFFLALQLFGTRVALTAAGLTCFSAYALVYARDAKMYMPFWLAVTLHVACLLWWLRTRRALAWLAWVAAGVAMVGLHGSGFFLLPVDLLVVLTAPPFYWRNLPTLAGLLAWPVATAPALAVEWVGRRARWSFSPWDRFLAWPRSAWRRFQFPTFVGFGVGVAVMLAAPLGPLGYYSAFSLKLQHAATDERPQVNVGELGIGWVGEYNVGRGLPDDLLYTASAYLTGWEWPRHFPQRGIDDQAHADPLRLRLLQGATVALLALLAVGFIPWRLLFSRARARLDRIRQAARVPRVFRGRRVLWLGVWLTLVPWVTYTQSNYRPDGVLDGVAAVVLKSPPDVLWPRGKAVVLPSPPPGTAPSTQPSFLAGWRQTWADLRDATTRRWDLTRQTTVDTAQRWPRAWAQYRAAFTRGNLSGGGVTVVAVALVLLTAALVWRWRTLWRGTAVLAAVVVGLAALCMLIAMLPRWIDNDLWLPRYLGTIFPAVLVLVAVLIDRQPWWLRGVTLGLFVTVNLAQFSMRVWGEADAPTALMAADVVAAQPRSVMATHPAVVTFRAYTDFNRFWSPEPGGGTLPTEAGRYYLRMLSGVPGDLRGVRDEGRVARYESCLNLWYFADAGAIERDLARSPQIERFVVWTGLPAGEVDQTDPVADRLKGRFKKVGDEIWPVRDHWRWYERFQVRRRTYERLPGATTRPATKPSPLPVPREKAG